MGNYINVASLFAQPNMTIDKITDSSIDYPEEEYLSSRRRRRRSSSFSLEIDNQSLANDVIKSSVDELVNPSKKSAKINSSIDLTLLLSNKVVIDLNDYPDILDMLAAHRDNKADNYPDDLSYGHYQLPRFLPRGEIGYAYAFYEEGEDGKIHFFEHDEDTGEDLEISLENACLKYREQFYRYVVCKDVFPAFEKILTCHGWKLSTLDLDSAFSWLDTRLELEYFSSILDFKELPKNHDDVINLLMNFFVQELPWNNYSCHFSFSDISLNLENMEPYPWLESKDLSLPEKLRLSADYDIKFHLNLFNYFIEKSNETTDKKLPVIHKIIGVLVSLSSYYEDTTSIVETLAQKAKVHSWIEDVVKERVEYLKSIFDIAEDYISDLNDFRSEFDNALDVI